MYGRYTYNHTYIRTYRCTHACLLRCLLSGEGYFIASDVVAIPYVPNTATGLAGPISSLHSLFILPYYPLLFLTSVPPGTNAETEVWGYDRLCHPEPLPTPTHLPAHLYVHVVPRLVAPGLRSGGCLRAALLIICEFPCIHVSKWIGRQLADIR